MAAQGRVELSCVLIGGSRDSLDTVANVSYYVD